MVAAVGAEVEVAEDDDGLEEEVDMDGSEIDGTITGRAGGGSGWGSMADGGVELEGVCAGLEARVENEMGMLAGCVVEDLEKVEWRHWRAFERGVYMAIPRRHSRVTYYALD
jgi:hypothetical protein